MSKRIIEVSRTLMVKINTAANIIVIIEITMVDFFIYTAILTVKKSMPTKTTVITAVMIVDFFIMNPSKISIPYL